MKKVLVTGGRGLIGSAFGPIQNVSDEIVLVGRDNYDLTKEVEVEKMFRDIAPDQVVHTAARVGGIGMNLATPIQQYYDNIMMNTLVLQKAFEHGVKKFIAFSSACAFPATAPLLSESILHDGPPYPAHGSYAYAKRMVEIQASTIRNQTGLNFCTLIPGNIFGERDNFDLEYGHVVPSLIHRCFLARKAGVPFEVWGDGSAQREFLYAGDVVDICMRLLKLEILPERLIVAGEMSVPISRIVEIITEKMRYSNIKWLTDKPNGQPFRRSSQEVFREYFPEFSFVSLEHALEKTIAWFENSYPEVRTCPPL
jgi:GDP-L-fucose synthase